MLKRYTVVMAPPCADYCWAQYRSTPSWGRWYLIDKVDV